MYDGRIVVDRSWRTTVSRQMVAPSSALKSDGGCAKRCVLIASGDPSVRSCFFLAIELSAKNISSDFSPFFRSGERRDLIDPSLHSRRSWLGRMRAYLSVL